MSSSSSSQSRVSRFISMVRLALVTSVTWTPPSRPAGHVPQQPAVGVAEDRVALVGRRTDPVDVVEDPLDLAAGEVGRRRQARLLPNGVAVTVALEGAGDAVGAGVLPDDGVVVRPAGVPVPHDGGLALVGDAQGGEVGGLQGRLVQRALHDRGRALPDLDRVVLDPARLRQDLLVLELVLGHLVAVVVEDHETGARRALVDRSDEVGHRSSWVCGGLAVQRVGGAAGGRWVRGQSGSWAGSGPGGRYGDRP